MFKLIRLWYRTRTMRYAILSTTLDELQEKFNKNPGGLTLTEFGQLHYMGQEILSIDAIRKAAEKSFKDDVEETEEPKPDKAEGMYL